MRYRHRKNYKVFLATLVVATLFPVSSSVATEPIEDTPFPTLHKIIEPSIVSSKGVIDVYVVDSGYHISEGLSNSVAQFKYIDFTETSDSGKALEDCSSHGTVVSSILAEEAAALNVKINLYSLKVFGCSEAPYTNSAALGKAFDWILANSKYRKPGVVNLSFSFSAEAFALKDKISDVVKSGMVVVTSSGNKSTDACGRSPADINGVVTVGNIRIKPSIGESVIDESSNIGECVDLYSLGSYRCKISDRVNKSCGGTSFAAPVVSARLAKYLAEYGSGITANNAVDILKEDSEYSAKSNYYYIIPSDQTSSKKYYQIVNQ